MKYVITLDADTILGRDGARRLIGTLAHPLNHAQADPRTGRVVHGYGLLQPRTEITPTSANYSRFSRIFAGDIGLDLYTNAVSNVYQDLFGSGIYIGKGIYDVDAFETQPGRPRAREYVAQPRSVRGHPCAGRLGHGHRLVRRLPAVLSDVHTPAAPLDAR